MRILFKIEMCCSWVCGCWQAQAHQNIELGSADLQINYAIGRLSLVNEPGNRVWGLGRRSECLFLTIRFKTGRATG